MTIDFVCAGKSYTCSAKAKFLLEEANGTSSYTLVRGFAAQPLEAVKCYEETPAFGNKKKRLTMYDDGKRTVIARTK